MVWMIDSAHGPMHYDPRTMTLVGAAGCRALTQGQATVLSMLCRDERVDAQTHGRATLGQPHDYGSRILHNHVMRLRRILGRCAIVTIRNGGYRLATRARDAGIGDRSLVLSMPSAFNTADLAANSAVGAAADRRWPRYVAERLAAVAIESGDAAPLSAALAAWRDDARADRVLDRLQARGLEASAVVAAASDRGPVMVHIGSNLDKVYGARWRAKAIGAPVELQPDAAYGRFVRDDFSSVIGLGAMGQAAAIQPRVERIYAQIAGESRKSYDYRRLILPVLWKTGVAALSVSKVDRIF
ncbi:MAG: helix-turn-helix domain-containing protein [Alphaproteobacteria bacterium]|nr:helix-turn-helix domain-containing protein [Alphaproteobacteria bacterium]